MSAEPLPDWLRPPPQGFMADDLDRLPGLPQHTELIDGSLVFVSPQSKFHALVIFLLMSRLSSAAPSAMRVRNQMTITLDDRQRLEPDVLIVDAAHDGGMKQTTYRPADVIMVIEVVSVESERRDRERKPQLYASAGIEHFWRIENVDDRPVAYTYELDPATKSYVPTGIHHDRLQTTVPFPIDIDLAEIDKL